MNAKQSDSPLDHAERLLAEADMTRRLIWLAALIVGLLAVILWRVW